MPARALGVVVPALKNTRKRLDNDLNPEDVIRPGDDPVKVVAAAREAMLNVRQPYRCKFQWPGLGAKLNEVSTYEITDREHYRFAIEKRAGALIQKEDEMIMVGEEAFRRKAENDWDTIRGVTALPVLFALLSKLLGTAIRRPISGFLILALCIGFLPAKRVFL
jgi:hypothetical protein